MKKLVILLVFALFGCTEKITERIIEKQTKADDGGTIDSAGGGNGINGRPLESYRIDMSKSLLVSEFLLGRLEIIQVHIPEFAARAYHVLSNRGWYFVPIELSHLPSTRIGTYFSSDQLALQSLREVWIDSRIFESMSIQDQVLLLIHEMVIGVKLQSYATGFDNCIARGGWEQIVDKKTYSERTKKCQQMYPAGYSEPEKSFYLSNSDYSSVRDITTKIFSMDATSNYLELRDLLEAKGLGAYEYE